MSLTLYPRYHPPRRVLLNRPLVNLAGVIHEPDAFDHIEEPRAHGTGIHRAAHAGRIVECGEHHDGQHGEALAQLADERKPAHAGQGHVEQYQIEIGIGCRGSEPFLSRSGRDDPDSVTEPFEGRGNSFQDERMIVDDE